MTLPYDLFLLIVRCAHPIAGRKVRCLNKALSELVTLDDLLWGEAGWRWNQSAIKCWTWAAANGHGRIVGALQQVDLTGTLSFGWVALAIAAEKGHGEIVRILVGAAVGDNTVWESCSKTHTEVAGTRRGTSQELESEINEILRSSTSSTFQCILRSLPSASSNVNEYIDFVKDFDPYLKVTVKDDSLAMAANKGHKEVVQLLIQAGANVNVYEGRPLMNAARNGHLEVVQLLLEEGAEDGKDAAFSEAIKQGNVELVQLLISAGVNVNENAWDILDQAFHSGCSSQTIRLLLDHGMDVHVDNDSTIIFAAGYGDLEIVQLLLDKGANVNAQNTKALMGAVRRRHLEVVQLLLDAGADVHALNDRALSVAAMNGYLAVAKLLLDAGADVHAQNEKALGLAAKKGHLAVVAMLLDAGADVHAQNVKALGLAAKNGHSAVVAMLLDAGADVHAAIELEYVVAAWHSGWHSGLLTLTALGWAATCGHLAVVELLLKAGADVHAQNEKALGLAAMNGHLAVVAMLLDAGADVHADFKVAFVVEARHMHHTTLTALGWAATYGHLAVVELLLKAGADVHAEDDEALGRAAENGHLEVVRFLLKAGLDVNAQNGLAFRKEKRISTWKWCICFRMLKGNAHKRCLVLCWKRGCKQWL